MAHCDHCDRDYLSENGQHICGVVRESPLPRSWLDCTSCPTCHSTVRAERVCKNEWHGSEAETAPPADELNDRIDDLLGRLDDIGREEGWDGHWQGYNVALLAAAILRPTDKGRTSSGQRVPTGGSDV